MEFMKRVFYIMICSPGDVEFERSSATKVIQAWNRENLSSDIVLVPISYEDAVSNHTIGDPQNIINEDVLSMSSMAVVIIWSTLGRKNKKGEYYTIEEINNHIIKGLPTMICFCTAPISQDSDFRAFQEVLDFKTKPESLLHGSAKDDRRTCFYLEYNDRSEFRDMFRSALQRAVNKYFCLTKYNSSPALSQFSHEQSISRSSSENSHNTPVTSSSSISNNIPTPHLSKDTYNDCETASFPKYVEFGTYPQEHVTIDPSQSLLTCISSQADGSIFRDWSTQQLYFKPHDINLAAYASRYYYSDGKKISKNGSHYFRISPIKWRVLQHGDKTSLLLSEQILDWRHFLEKNLIEPQGNMILSTVEGCPNGTRANNWEWSSLRKWLNTYFLSAAFTPDEQTMIIDKTLSNGPITGCIDDSVIARSLQCSDTTDKVFILSYSDLINPNYGFNPDPMKKDPSRIATVTDFSIARGVKPSRLASFETSLVGWWWLRSPANYKMYYSYTNHKYDGSAPMSPGAAEIAKEAAQCRVCDVMHDGHVCTRGSIVDGAFITSAEESCDGTANGVRIAIEVKNSAFNIP